MRVKDGRQQKQETEGEEKEVKKREEAKDGLGQVPL